MARILYSQLMQVKSLTDEQLNRYIIEKILGQEQRTISGTCPNYVVSLDLIASVEDLLIDLLGMYQVRSRLETLCNWYNKYQALGQEKMYPEFAPARIRAEVCYLAWEAK